MRVIIAINIQEHRHFDRIILRFNACVKRAVHWTLVKRWEVCVTVWIIVSCTNDHHLLSKFRCPYPRSLLVAIDVLFSCISHGSAWFNRRSPWTSRLVWKWRSKFAARSVLPVFLCLSLFNWTWQSVWPKKDKCDPLLIMWCSWISHATSSVVQKYFPFVCHMRLCFRFASSAPGDGDLPSSLGWLSPVEPFLRNCWRSVWLHLEEPSVQCLCHRSMSLSRFRTWYVSLSWSFQQS